MAEKMLVTQALDERDLLVKKINDKIENASFVDVKKNNEDKDLISTAEDMRLSILGKDAKVKDDKPLAVVETYVKENTMELVDPLDVEKKISALKEKQDKLLTELDTQIKVSNATTFVEF